MRFSLASILLLLSAAITAIGEPPTTRPSDLEPLPLKLPVFSLDATNGPVTIPEGIHVDWSNRGKPRGPFLAPKGIRNVALNKPVTGSEQNPIMGTLDQITDGDKSYKAESLVEMSRGLQWVQMDLEGEHEIWAIVFWQRHDVKIPFYHDVIVQVSSDPDFKNGVTTLFNNDFDNSSKLGKGADFEFDANAEGKLVDGKRIRARYVRLYSNGSTHDEQNHWTEVEVCGVPVK